MLHSHTQWHYSCTFVLFTYYSRQFFKILNSWSSVPRPICTETGCTQTEINMYQKVVKFFYKYILKTFFTIIYSFKIIIYSGNNVYMCAIALQQTVNDQTGSVYLCFSSVDNIFSLQLGHICNVWNISEDVFHFVLECQLDLELSREISIDLYIPRFYRVRPNIQKLTINVRK